MKLCTCDHNGNPEKVDVVRIERHPKGMKKGFCILHLKYGHIVCFHYKDIRKNVEL